MTIPTFHEAVTLMEHDLQNKLRDFHREAKGGRSAQASYLDGYTDGLAFAISVLRDISSMQVLNYAQKALERKDMVKDG